MGELRKYKLSDYISGTTWSSKLDSLYNLLCSDNTVNKWCEVTRTNIGTREDWNSVSMVPLDSSVGTKSITFSCASESSDMIYVIRDGVPHSGAANNFNPEFHCLVDYLTVYDGEYFFIGIDNVWPICWGVIPLCKLGSSETDTYMTITLYGASDTSGDYSGSYSARFRDVNGNELTTSAYGFGTGDNVYTDGVALRYSGVANSYIIYQPAFNSTYYAPDMYVLDGGMSGSVPQGIFKAGGNTYMSMTLTSTYNTGVNNVLVKL